MSSNLPQSYVHAAEAAAKSDADAKKSQESKNVKGVQDPHSYTAAAEAAAKSNADALLNQLSPTPDSVDELIQQTATPRHTYKYVVAPPA